MPDAVTENSAVPFATPPKGSNMDLRSEVRTTRLVAIVTGLLGAILAILTPFLPVVQTDSSITWPDAGVIEDIDAPLVSQAPISFSATIPCSAIDRLPPQGGLLLATAPPQGQGAALNSLFVRVGESNVDVLDRNVVVASAPRAEVQNASCGSIEIVSNIDYTSAEFTGLVDEEGNPRSGRLDGDLRPQIAGLFTDLEGAAPAGMSATIDIDSRFSSSPTVLKLLAMILAVVCTIIAMGALGKLDGTDGR
ncbi:MAG: arabinosyltransferase, partial [Rhodococcus sp. (in: high G+C Gram-positive bacteria)]